MTWVTTFASKISNIALNIDKHSHSASGLGFHLCKVTSSSIWAEASTRAPGKSRKMPKALIPIFQDLDFSTRCKESKRYAEKGTFFWERNVNYPLVVVHQNNASQCEPSNTPFHPFQLETHHSREIQHILLFWRDLSLQSHLGLDSTTMMVRVSAVNFQAKPFRHSIAARLQHSDTKTNQVIPS